MNPNREARPHPQRASFVHGEMLTAILCGEWWLYPSVDGQEPVAERGDAAEIWATVCGLVRTDV